MLPDIPPKIQLENKHMKDAPHHVIREMQTK